MSHSMIPWQRATGCGGSVRPPRDVLSTGTFQLPCFVHWRTNRGRAVCMTKLPRKLPFFNPSLRCTCEKCNGRSSKVNHDVRACTRSTPRGAMMTEFVLPHRAPDETAMGIRFRFLPNDNKGRAVRHTIHGDERCVQSGRKPCIDGNEVACPWILRQLPDDSSKRVHDPDDRGTA